MVRILRAATWNFGYGSVGSPSKNNKMKVQKALEYLKESAMTEESKDSNANIAEPEGFLSSEPDLLKY